MSYIINQFRGEYSYLSNFYEAPLTVLGIPFQSSEAAYMACKTENIELRRKFSTLSPKEAKYEGRKLTLRPNWNGLMRLECMELCVRSKFAHNPDLIQKLINTGHSQLVEGNYWGDKYWGVCLKTNEGKNMLGEILMAVRDTYNSIN